MAKASLSPWPPASTSTSRAPVVDHSTASTAARGFGISDALPYGVDGLDHAVARAARVRKNGDAVGGVGGDSDAWRHGQTEAEGHQANPHRTSFPTS